MTLSDKPCQGESPTKIITRRQILQTDCTKDQRSRKVYEKCTLNYQCTYFRFRQGLRCVLIKLFLRHQINILICRLEVDTLRHLLPVIRAAQSLTVSEQVNGEAHIGVIE